MFVGAFARMHNSHRKAHKGGLMQDCLHGRCHGVLKHHLDVARPTCQGMCLKANQFLQVLHSFVQVTESHVCIWQVWMSTMGMVLQTNDLGTISLPLGSYQSVQFFQLQICPVPNLSSYQSVQFLCTEYVDSGDSGHTWIW